MIILESGINTIYITNQGFVNSAFTMVFESALLIESKTITTTYTGATDRYITFNIELVSEGNEDLDNNKIFLIKGSHQLTITQGDLEYTDIAFVQFDALTDKKYSSSKKIHVYKKNG